MDFLEWLEAIKLLEHVETRICMYDDKSYYSKDGVINLIDKLKKQLIDLRRASNEQEAE